MSARRWIGGAALAALVALAAAAPAQAQIVAQVGGALAGKVGDTLDVPVTVDLRGAAGVRLGSYRMTLRYNSDVLAYEQVTNGTFSPPLVNTDSSYEGANSVLRLTAVQPSGADSVVTLFVARFLVVNDTGASDITISFDEMSAAGSFADLLPSLTVVNGTFCHGAGRWGDVDGDGLANSRDALIALSKVVGLRLDTTVVVQNDTIVTMRPSLADVDGDGQVTSRDALIIVSYAVGLPVTGFRIGLAAAGACGSGLGITLAVSPDTLDLQTGQTANVVVTARDGGGQLVSLNGATWTSGNSAVAGATGATGGYGGFGVDARDPGTAILTVRLGASYSASMVVRVIAHRSQWYVDASRVQAALQTGSAAFPFAYIQDAFDAGRDGDTINVAAGRYEEAVSSDISVLLRGTDPANPPVLDARGAAYYNAYTAALSAGSRAAPMVIENLAVDHGHIAIAAHDLTARRVHIEGDSLNAPLYFYSATSLASSDTGNIVLDSVRIHGYGDAQSGIQIGLADSAIIRNSAVTRDVAGTAYCYPSLTAGGGIQVLAATHTEIRNTTVTNSPCMGIAVGQYAGSATFSGNRVSGLPGSGIAVSAPQIAFDHNLIRDVRLPYYYYATTNGIWVTTDQPVQTVSSLADTLRNIGAYGIAVQAGTAVTIDSLVADSLAQDGGYGYAGVDVYNARLTLTHSRIADVTGNVGVSVWAGQASNRSVLESRHNVIERTDYQGIYASRYGPGGGAPPVQPGPPVQRGPMGPTNYGPDTVISVGDSIRATGSSALQAESGLYFLMDTTVVDSTSSDGVYVNGVARATIRASHIRRVPGSGLDLVADTALVTGTSADSSGFDGLYFSGGVLTVDSTRFAGNGDAGIHTYCYFCSGTASITRSTLAGNGIGLMQDGYSGSVAVVARRNVIGGNVAGGASNPGYANGGPPMDADTNFWGDTGGPTCSPAIGNCPGTLGDSVLTGGISFAGWLAAAPSDVMPAPRFVRPVARTSPAQVPAAIAAAAQGRPTPPARPAAATVPQPPSRPTMLGWRKGRPPQPARVHHPE